MYTERDLLNAFTLFADAEGSTGRITQKALRNALVRVCLAMLVPGPTPSHEERFSQS